jgi:hypothetical protein
MGDDIMGQREDEVENTIRKVCTEYFYKDLFDKGTDILYKFYLKDYLYLDNINSKRDLLFHLIVGESRRKKPSEEAIEKYSIQLKNDMDNTPNYKVEHLGEYLSMMSYYTECKNIKISKEELLEYYDISIEYNKKQYELNKIKDERKTLNSFIKLKNAEFNKSMLLKNFNNILLIIEELHSLNEMKSISTMRQMLSSIEKLDDKLYKNAMDIIVNTSELCV